MNINETFDQILKIWDTFPAPVRKKFYMPIYKHIRYIQLLGMAKKIEIIEACGYQINVKKIGETMNQESLTNEKQVIFFVITHLGDYSEGFYLKYKRAISALIVDIDDKNVSKYTRRAIIEAAGFVHIYVKKNL